MKSGLTVNASRAWGRRISLQSILETASARTGEYPASDPRCDPSWVLDGTEPARGKVVNKGFLRRGGQLSAWIHRQKPVWTHIVGESQSFQHGGRSLETHELGLLDIGYCFTEWVVGSEICLIFLVDSYRAASEARSQRCSRRDELNGI
jgi:hypothetical protein